MRLMEKKRRSSRKSPNPPKQSGQHKTPRRHIPVPADLAELLEKIAGANDRPLGWEAARAIRAHVEAEAKRLGITPPENDSQSG